VTSFSHPWQSPKGCGLPRSNEWRVENTLWRLDIVSKTQWLGSQIQSQIREISGCTRAATCCLLLLDCHCKESRMLVGSEDMQQRRAEQGNSKYSKCKWIARAVVCKERRRLPASTRKAIWCTYQEYSLRGLAIGPNVAASVSWWISEISESAGYRGGIRSERWEK